MRSIGLFITLGLGLALNTQLVAMNPCNDPAEGLKKLIEVIKRINNDHKNKVTLTASTLDDSESSALQIALLPVYENDIEYRGLFLQLSKSLKREILVAICSAQKNYILATIDTVQGTLKNQENFYLTVCGALNSINLSVTTPIQDYSFSLFSFEDETYLRELDQQT